MSDKNNSFENSINQKRVNRVTRYICYHYLFQVSCLAFLLLQNDHRVLSHKPFQSASTILFPKDTNFANNYSRRCGLPFVN